MSSKFDPMDVGAAVAKLAHRSLSGEAEENKKIPPVDLRATH
jgi:hypothetical protein